VKQVVDRPEMRGEIECHSGRTETVNAFQARKGELQGLVGSNEMIVKTKPLAMEAEMMFGLGIRPGATRKGSDGLTKSEVDALDESGLDKGA